MKIIDKNEILFFHNLTDYNPIIILNKTTNKSSNTYDLSPSKFEKGGNIIVTVYSIIGDEMKVEAERILFLEPI